MRLRSGFVAAIALAASLTVLVPAEAVPLGITGTVLGPGGSPLAGVPVTAYSWGWDDPNDQEVVATTTTDGDGNYLLPVTSSTVYVCFLSPDHVHECWNGVYRAHSEIGEYVGTPVVSPAEGVGGIDASLIVGSSISGTTSTPNRTVGGMYVKATIDGEPRLYFGVGESDGTYTLDHLEPATYTVCAYSLTLIEQCTGDVGGPASYTVDEDDVITDADIEFVPRPESLHVVHNGYDRVRVAWDAVPGATSYLVIWSTSRTFSKFSTRSVTGTAATIANLYFLYGQTYYIAVRASNGESTTARSSIISANIYRVTGVHAAVTSPTSVTWAWKPFLPAEGYQIQISSLSSFAGYRSVKTNASPATFANLSPGTTYYARVRPLNAEGAPIAGWSKQARGSTDPT